PTSTPRSLRARSQARKAIRARAPSAWSEECRERRTKTSWPTFHLRPQGASGASSGVLRTAGLCSHESEGMTESTGKPETGELTGHREPVRPTSRRDPRADPDDEPSSARVDVVHVDRSAKGDAPPDSLTNAALTLRRELAKLHQQAAAVE